MFGLFKKKDKQEDSVKELAVYAVADFVQACFGGYQHNGCEDIFYNPDAYSKFADN